MTYQETMTESLSAFVSGLVSTGVKDVVISPGSRSTPLALLMAENRELDVYINIDERSSGFFALGLAKASGKPAVLLCTSGTAAANYYPAVAEADISRVPLIVLTADRPHELRDVGAPQTIDQIGMYGSHVRWFHEAAPPGPGQDRYAFSLGVRAVKEATNLNSGPVHLNFPLREPLIPNLDPDPFAKTFQSLEIATGNLSLPADTIKKITALIQEKEKGLIICGEIRHPGFSKAVRELAAHTGYPVLADPLSQLRSDTADDPHIIDSYDAILKSEQAADRLKPDIIIRFGSMPVSKPLTLYLKRWADIPHIIVDGGAGWRDPQNLGTMMVHCDEAAFCKEITAHLPKSGRSGWLETWSDLDRLAKKTIAAYLKTIDDMDEGKTVYELAGLLPDGSTIFAGNSMPIRDVDTFFHKTNKTIYITGNRGANGIDGVLSAATGVARYRQPLYLIIGDLSFFHDLNGLFAAKRNHIPINIILINNDGGGIFSFLPQSKLDRHYELLFGTPTGLDFSQGVKMFGGTYAKPETWAEFRSLIKKSTEQKGINVIEIRTDRQKNVLSHRKMWERIGKEIDYYFGADKK